MEDYKEKYEAAIEQAKKELQTCGSSDCDAARQIFRFFPELKESEDDKIRKEIISYLRGCYGASSEDHLISKRKEWIAWIEKQGEQTSINKIEPKWKKGNDGEVLYETSVVWVHNETKTLATAGLLLDSNTFYIPISELEKLPKEEFKKHCEQSPTEDNCKISDCDTKVDMPEYNKGFECGKQKVLKYPEDFDLCKKSIWSEDDVKKIDKIIWLIEHYASHGHEKELRKDVVNWLKSLKENFIDIIK